MPNVTSLSLCEIDDRLNLLDSFYVSELRFVLYHNIKANAYWGQAFMSVSTPEFINSGFSVLMGMYSSFNNMKLFCCNAAVPAVVVHRWEWQTGFKATEDACSWKRSGLQSSWRKKKRERAHLLFMFSCRGVKSFVKPLIVLLTLSLQNVLSQFLRLNITLKVQGRERRRKTQGRWGDREEKGSVSFFPA